MNDVVEHQNKPKDPVQTVKKKEVLIVLPFLEGLDGGASKTLNTKIFPYITSNS